MEKEDRVRAGPDGGFHLITVVQLCLVWWAYKTGLIRYQDLRAYFGCHELAHRRFHLKRGQVPCFKVAELSRLLGGVGEESARAAIRRLEAAGLMTWSEQALTFARSPEQLTGTNLDGFWAMLEKVTNHRRSVPVPRRILTFIAGGARQVLVATILGHLFRCLYYRAAECHPVGTCKASWVADVFGVDERNVKAARRHLERELGWLVPLESPWWHQNRYGKSVAIDLTWSPKSAAGVGVDNSAAAPAGSPPLPDGFATKPPPPRQNKNLSERLENQNLGEAAPEPPTGFCKPTEGEAASAAPSFTHVVPQDLTDSGRLLQLFDDCVKRGIVNDTERDKLNVFALAERARSVGAKSPCALFAYLLRGRRWEFITEGYDDAAQRRLKAHLYGEPRRAVETHPPTDVGTRDLSDDARFARSVRQVLRNQKFTGDEFAVVRQARSDWSRARWEAAVEELETPRAPEGRVEPRTVSDAIGGP